MKEPYMPPQQAAYVNWHDNLKDTATISVPGVVAADVTAMAANNTILHAKLTAANAADAAAKAAHADLNTAIAASRKQARTMVKNIKNNAAYTTALGDTLRIEGAEDSTDMTQAKPKLIVNPRTGGLVEVGFKKGLAEGIHVESMRDGDTEFTLLASETHAPYVDNRPLAVAGKPETRRYRAVFFQGKAEVGLPSDVVTATAQP